MLAGPGLDLVRSIKRAGAQIQVDADGLRVTAGLGVLTNAIKEELVARKPEILNLFDEAFRLLNERGVRLIPGEGGNVVAVWSDADGRELRDALELIGAGETEILHLDDPDAEIASRYHQFVPEYVKRIWAARGLLSRGPQRVEAAARARLLNRFFDTYGTSPRPSAITTDTVLHGMLRRSGDVE